MPAVLGIGGRGQIGGGFLGGSFLNTFDFGVPSFLLPGRFDANMVHWIAFEYCRFSRLPSIGCFFTVLTNHYQ